MTIFMLCILLAFLSLYFLYLILENCCNLNNNYNGPDIEMVFLNQNNKKIEENQVNFHITSETQMNKQNVQASASEELLPDVLFEFEENLQNKK